MTRQVSLMPGWALFSVFLFFFLCDYYIFVPLWDISLGTMVPVFIWIYSLGVIGFRALPQNINMSKGKFLTTFAYTVGFHIITSLRLDVGIPYGIKGPFLFLAWLSFLYSIYFVTKCIKCVELNRTAVPSEWISIFAGLLLYPIGVWFIQPKIQNIARTHEV